ncbi:MAG: folylpolyglutamate synthase/dihydrofolate synthase family protein [Acutalibacteraceae bacterium]|nr:folylpolyglutamate synthase/dihydrofolate synthase family protein [Acutalibacteraceae bacterium]
MTYDEALEFIYSRRKFQKSSGHERIERLLELLGCPHKKLRFVHIVGTNGKGSVSTALSEVLKEGGYKTGLFTSPFIFEFGERIKVNGEFIPKSKIAELASLIKEKTLLMEKEDLYPTVFEVTTALGMLYFASCDCDIVVLEAGIGGRNDSTNVIDAPELAVITSVSLDHTEMLGNSVEQIAKEKCGILKDGCPMVSYPIDGAEFGYIPQPESVAEVIRQECKKGGNTLYVPDTQKLTIENCSLSGTVLSYDGLTVNINLCGKHQIANMLTVITAAKVLREKGYNISDESIRKGIEGFKMAGRTEIIEGEPTIILDGGHNVGCMKALKETAESFLKERKITLLMSFMKDKAYEEAISLIAPLCENIIFTQTDSIRGEIPETLSEIAKKYCGSVYAVRDPEEAFKLAKEKAQGDVLIVAGSFYLVSEVRNKFL